MHLPKHNRRILAERHSLGLLLVWKTDPNLCLLLSFFLIVSQITVFRMGSEGHQDIDLAILTALLKGGSGRVCVCAGA